MVDNLKEKNLKIVKVFGGLGNQMFQYAFFLSLINKNIPTQIDITAFKYYNLHNGFELQNVFGLKLKQYYAHTNDIKKLKDNKVFFKLRRFIVKTFDLNKSFLIKKSHFIETNYTKYDKDVYKLHNLYLDGYWQSFLYLEPIKDSLLSTFKWKNLSLETIEIAKEMKNCISVTIHVRRYDKFTSLKDIFYFIRLKIIWRICSRSYYIKAVNYFKNKFNNEEIKFFIFSNDINWAEKEFSESNMIIVKHNTGKNSNQDMFLMTQAKHNIISMSSFSWWGAWLNVNPNKIVIAPKKWALRFVKDVNLIPDEWIRI